MRFCILCQPFRDPHPPGLSARFLTLTTVVETAHLRSGDRPIRSAILRVVPQDPRVGMFSTAALRGLWPFRVAERRGEKEKRCLDEPFRLWVTAVEERALKENQGQVSVSRPTHSSTWKCFCQTSLPMASIVTSLPQGFTCCFHLWDKGNKTHLICQHKRNI